MAKEREPEKPPPTMEQLVQRQIFEYLRDNLTLNVKLTNGVDYSNITQSIEVSIHLPDPTTGVLVEIVSARESM